MKKIGDLLVGIGLIVSIIVGVLCTILSFIATAIVLRFTPIAVVVLVILELCAVTTFGIWTVLLYGVLTYFGAFVILFIITILAAFITAK